MTRMGKLQTMAMGLYNDSYEEDVNGLVSETELDGFSVHSSWDDPEEETEEDFIPVPKSKKTKPHILDRADSIIYGGFVRHKFYKEHGRKTPLTVSTSQSEGTCCRHCQTKVADQLDKTNLFGSLHFGEVYFKAQDAGNRELPELVLALLQLFDWVGTCPSCDELNYGYFKAAEETVVEPAVETSKPTLEQRAKRLVERAENFAASVTEDIKTKIEEPKKLAKPIQLSIFDFEDAGEPVHS